MLTVLVLLYNLSSNLFTTTNTYYFKYIVGNVGLASAVSIVSIITPVAIILYQPITKKTGTVKFMKMGTDR